MSQLNPKTLIASTVLYPSPGMVSDPTVSLPFPSTPLHACTHQAHVHECCPHWAQSVVLGHKHATCGYKAKCQWPRMPWGHKCLKPTFFPARIFTLLASSPQRLKCSSCCFFRPLTFGFLQPLTPCWKIWHRELDRCNPEDAAGKQMNVY